MITEKEVVLSGIRATGRLHIGNYFGVLKRFASYSKDPTKKCFYFIADFHTLTTLKEAELVKSHLPNVVLDYLAAGIDAEQAVIYAQSSIPEICELSWFLACLSPIGELQRMPTFKDKIKKQPDNINVGLFYYPVLMAADILAPRANLVPVGKDQEPHLEFTCSLAKKFNRHFGEFFPVPNALTSEMITVPGLESMNQDGSFSKMGKSDNNTINLSDTPEMIWQKIRVSPTDPSRIHKSDHGNPQKCAISALHRFTSTNDDQQKCSDGCLTAKIGCIECKKILANNLSLLLEPFQHYRQKLSHKQNLVKDVLVEGARKARVVISETVNYVREKMGIVGF